MTYREAPNVKNIQRQYFFPEISWLDVEYFKEIENINTLIPFLIASDGVTKMFVGKTVPDYSDWRNPMTIYEVIGTVVRDLNGNYCLRVPYDSRVFEVREKFLILSLKDDDSFEWKNDANEYIPNYALKGSLHNTTSEIFYIGRSLPNETSAIRCHNHNWSKCNEPVTSIGTIDSTHGCLYAPIDDSVVCLLVYEVLCLKPSPASLKVLCRLVVRGKIGHNVNIMRQTFENKLPNSIIQYLEYPSKLRYGEYLLKGEKLVSSCGSFELFINNTNEMICKDNKKNVNIGTISNIHSLYLYNNKIIMNHLNGNKFQIFAYIYFNRKMIPNEYSLEFSNKNDFFFKYFIIEIYDNNGNVIHKEKVFRSVFTDVNEQCENDESDD